MVDSYRHKGLRRKLVEGVKCKGIQDKRVLEAIGKIPRHQFIDSSFLEYAYQDKAFPIGSGQTISQPYTVAFQTELLQVRKGDKILEIGTGSGYQASILAELGAIVYSIERQKPLYLKAEGMLRKLGFFVKLFHGDGYKGLPEFAPFDKILITASTPEVPAELLKQLKIGGILVAPVGEGDKQIMKALLKQSENKYSTSEHGTFRFVPMLENTVND